MRIKLLVLTLFCLFFGVGSVFAQDPPTLSTPTNNSTVTSSKLEWQTPSYSLYSSNPYRIQVDDETSFTSINKDYYTSNTHYTPTLSLGVWNWRVKSKDVNGSWSDWSNIWSFTLSDSIQTPSPSPTPTPSASPTPSPTSSNLTSAFVLSSVPNSINSDQNFTASVQLVLPSNPNTNFYLKGAFKRSDGSNYFGQTLVSGSWVKNGSSYSSQFPVTTDSSGNWSGNLEVKPDNEDSGFTGNGDYIFKIARYTSSGSGPSWSNEININVEAVNTPSDETGSSITQSDPTSKPSSTPISQASKSIVTKATTSPKFNYQIASVAGASSLATPSGKIEIKSHKQTNFLFWAGILLIFAGMSSIGYIYLRKNADTRITLRKRN